MGAHQDMPSSSITSFVGSCISARVGAHQDLSSIVEDSLLLTQNHPSCIYVSASGTYLFDSSRMPLNPPPHKECTSKE
jgi:hypothetical protein